jgi:two-component system NtrC family sensor kinase
VTTPVADSTSLVLLADAVALLAAEGDPMAGLQALATACRSASAASAVGFTFSDDTGLTPVWSAPRDAGRDGRAQGSSSGGDWGMPLRTASGETLGALHVVASGPLPDAAAPLVRMVASLGALVADRARRLRSLEREVTTHVREVAGQRRFIECIIDSLPVGLYVVDRDYRISAWNHTREQGLYGVARDDAIGRTIFEVLQRQPAGLLRREFDEVFATGRLQQFQMESESTGAPRSYRISKVPMRLDGDAVTHVITIGEDITDWKAAIDRTAQAEKLAALGQLAAGVMHELNNPLATIAACAETLALQPGIAPSTDAADAPGELVRIIDLEVQRCKKIVGGLLDFSRPKPASREVVDLSAVARRGLFLLQHHPRGKRVRLVPVLDETGALGVTGDADQLVQVLIALTINALDATPDGGSVTVRTAAAPDGDGTMRHVLEVADEGPGIPRALHAKVFEPFFTTKPPGQGTGLGLAICYGIVADHGGTIEVHSPEGEGATFRVLLPAAQGLRA